MADDFRLGDHYRIDDRTGLKIRASESVKEWTGHIVHKRHFRPRHPQELKRGVRDKQSVPDPRPRQVDTFVGPLITFTTVVAAAGSQSLTVESSARFAPGDHLRVGLDNREVFRVILQDVPNAETLTLTSPLPWSAAAGSQVTNDSAVAE